MTATTPRVVAEGSYYVITDPSARDEFGQEGWLVRRSYTGRSS